MSNTQEQVTSKFMSKFELSRIIGTRAVQISMDSPIKVKLEDGEIDPIEIAVKELKAKVIPIIIRRYFPEGTYEDIDANTLDFDNLLY